MTIMCSKLKTPPRSLSLSPSKAIDLPTLTYLPTYLPHPQSFQGYSYDLKWVSELRHKSRRFRWVLQVLGDVRTSNTCGGRLSPLYACCRALPIGCYSYQNNNNSRIIQLRRSQKGRNGKLGNRLPYHLSLADQRRPEEKNHRPQENPLVLSSFSVCLAALNPSSYLQFDRMY